MVGIHHGAAEGTEKAFLLRRPARRARAPSRRRARRRRVDRRGEGDMDAPEEIVNLVELFGRNIDAYRSGHYNETQVRREFIDPLFECLGWDVGNKKGWAEAYKDVVHEDAVRIGTATKAPDYCFRIGGARKFFVEAKKPSIDIKHDVHPAYQLRRYAWSAKLPLSVVTDFEEFAVYDCRVKPATSDNAGKARVMYIEYREYPERWAEIASIFAPEAILKGSFDRYAESTKRKRGTAEVDAAFLKEIESWRDMLARNIALRNAKLSQRELNFAVQRTIDRIIFLRICEARGIEPYARLQSVANGRGVYGRLAELFQRADERYNSGVFHFKQERGRPEAPDELTLDLAIDDKPLREIIGRLYYPESPYEFSVLPTDILGQVYEQFLGKVIRLTGGHRAVVEEKPEVRKAGGVYYTPTYIVDYIVKNTVGKLLEGRTPRTTVDLRILDPACGSGSFLLGAFQCLLDWHLEQHVGEMKATRKVPTVLRSKGKRGGKGEPAIYQGPRGDWRLTTAERKRILLANIFGVDIDPQAVEVTKLSLLLKVLESESGETLATQLKLFHERALPDLASNIKCGNSLIGPDFYENQQGTLFDEEERLRINAFHWKAEFPGIMRRGGFDAVIGNPPYVRQEALQKVKSYLSKRYDSYHSMADLYVYFMEKSMRLLAPAGLFSFIVSRSFLRTTYAGPLREFIRSNASVIEVVDFGGRWVFTNARDTYVCIPLLSRDSQQTSVNVCSASGFEGGDLGPFVSSNAYAIKASRLSGARWSLDREERTTLFERLLSENQALTDYANGALFYGIKTGFNKAFEIDKSRRGELVDQTPRANELIHRFAGGRDIRRYHIRDREKHLIVVRSGWTARTMQVETGRYPLSEDAAWKWFSDSVASVARHLAVFQENLKRRSDKGEFWWELRPCDYYDVLDHAKIVYPDIAKHPRFYLDTKGTYIGNTAYCIDSDSRYLLGVLCSRLTWFNIGNISIPFGTRAGRIRYRLIYQYMQKVPVRVIDFSNAADKARHDRMVELVESMLSLHKQVAAAKTPHEKDALQRRIQSTDQQIDNLVYELYGLTDDEIRIVEEAGEQ